MIPDGVTPVVSCSLKVVDRVWSYAVDNRNDIQRHWLAARAEKPGYFDGVIHLMCDGTLQDGHFVAQFLRTDFKSFLHWRDHGQPECGVRDAFGSAIIRAGDGAVLLGRQRPGNINSGLAYLPGGFIDPRDVSATGAIDIGASIARELAEETGLAPPPAAAGTGFLIARIGRQVSIAREFRFATPSGELRARILAHLASDPDPELDDIVIVHDLAGADPALVPPYTRLVLAGVFDRACADGTR